MRQMHAATEVGDKSIKNTHGKIYLDSAQGRKYSVPAGLVPRMAFRADILHDVGAIPLLFPAPRDISALRVVSRIARRADRPFLYRPRVAAYISRRRSRAAALRRAVS